eukprot:5038208-Pyramimonas_sp.AAC.1
MTENSSGKRPLEHDDEDRSSKRSAINSDTVFRLLVESKKVLSLTQLPFRIKRGLQDAITLLALCGACMYATCTM